MQVLTALFESYFGKKPTFIQEISNSASNRKYFRMEADSVNSVIGAIGTQREENEAFIYLAEHFKSKGLNVPKILCTSNDKLRYLQEDLGDCQLFGLLGNDNATPLLIDTIKELPRLQFLGAEGLDFSKCYPQAEFNRRSVFWDLNYFKYDFLKPFGLEFDENRLEDDFEHFADVLLNVAPGAFMYRDFQSRNIMIRDNCPWFIDFQGGRKGPVLYDLASFVYQAKAGFSADLKALLIDTYYEAMQQYCKMERAEFDTALSHIVLFRCLQTLGAYGFRGKIENKANFLSSIPFGVSNLKGILQEFHFEDTYLREILLKLANGLKFPPTGTKERLLVRVYSFSYKKGIPTDYSGNGGGFVFDCRSIHNPGKYEQYKKITGMDKPVQDFLENDGEILKFNENVFGIADRAVEKYIKRGFSDLMFSFGCTGGQHRSVYAAESLAKHLKEKFDCITIYVNHREQGIERTL